MPKIGETRRVQLQPAASNGERVEMPYPSVSAKLCIGPKALTHEQAMELLGWEVERVGDKFGKDYLTTDENGKKVRCHHNTKNRVLNEDWCRLLCYEILNRRWMFNGETIVIAKTGQVLSGQHRLIGLIRAYQLWLSSVRSDHWREKWPDGPPTLETLLVFGVDEAAIQTIDNVRPRSLADVIYTSELFKDMAIRHRKAVSQITAFTVCKMRQRTENDPEARRAINFRGAHGQSLDYLSRHPRLLECVSHIYQEDKNGSINRYVPNGAAAALMYLYAVSGDDVTEYRSQEAPSESRLSMGLWERSREFWTKFGMGDKTLGVLKESLKRARGEESNTEDGEGEETGYDVQMAVLVLAWQVYLKGKKIDATSLRVEYKTDPETGERTLARHYSVGGIDHDKPIPKEEERP